MFVGRVYFTMTLEPGQWSIREGPALVSTHEPVGPSREGYSTFYGIDCHHIISVDTEQWRNVATLT